MVLLVLKLSSPFGGASSCEVSMSTFFESISNVERMIQLFDGDHQNKSTLAQLICRVLRKVSDRRRQLGECIAELRFGYPIDLYKQSVCAFQ